MIDEVTKAPERRTEYAVLYRSGDGAECSVLMRTFHIYGSRRSASTAELELFNAVNKSYEFNVEAQPDTVQPMGDDLSLIDKLTKHFEAAMEGRVKRVDLRYCTGPVESRYKYPVPVLEVKGQEP